MGSVTTRSNVKQFLAMQATIPGLELVVMHMAANLCKNIKDSLEKQPIRTFYGWTDSSVALNWTRGRETYKQFVSNRVNKYVKRISSIGDTFQQIVTLLILVAVVSV